MDTGEQLSCTSPVQSLFNASNKGSQIWLPGTGRPELSHSQLIPNLPPPTYWAHSSLPVNRVTSLLPGIALRKDSSHKHTMVTNNTLHGHVGEVPYTCGHMSAHTLSQDVRTHCWPMEHKPSLPRRTMMTVTLLFQRFRPKRPNLSKGFLPRATKW